MIDVSTLIAIAAVTLALLTLLNQIRPREPTLTLREHEEFKARIINELSTILQGQYERLTIREADDRRTVVMREIDLIRAILKDLDDKKPTVGELSIAKETIEKRIERIERQINHPKNVSP